MGARRRVAAISAAPVVHSNVTFSIFCIPLYSLYLREWTVIVLSLRCSTQDISAHSDRFTHLSMFGQVHKVIVLAGSHTPDASLCSTSDQGLTNPFRGGSEYTLLTPFRSKEYLTLGIGLNGPKLEL
jgi:hypothetical protein